MMKMDVDVVKTMLKHREPFLFIDAIVNISTDTVEASLEIPERNLLLEGHFPGNPVIPGVLLIEAMAQAAGFLIAYNLRKGKGGNLSDKEHDFFLSRINSVKFKAPIIPPARLRIKIRIKSSLIENFCEADGQAFVDDELKAIGSLVLYLKIKNSTEGK